MSELQPTPTGRNAIAAENNDVEIALGSILASIAELR
jgi:hypothetical protein